MAWHCHLITYELNSPLHIGYHKVGSVQRTRYYIPARNMLAAAAEQLVEHGQQQAYSDALRWVQQNLAFSYFFIAANGSLLNPKYAGEGLIYGGLSAREFERRFLRSHVTTAIDHKRVTLAYHPKKRFLRSHVTTAIDSVTGGAEENSLHEVEYIAERWVDESGRAHQTYLQGCVFTCASADGLSILESLRAGGERRYGFGSLRRIREEINGAANGYELILDAPRPQIKIDCNGPLLAHAPVCDLQSARGMIEPLVGRETTPGGAFGKRLTPGVVCWVPGTILESAQAFEFAEDGTWKKVTQ